MTSLPHLRAENDKPLSAEPVELIAIDLDGTLLRSDGTLGPRSIKALAEATAAGVKVVLNTGRAPRGTRAVYQALGLKTLAVTHNGALVTDPVHGDAIFQHTTLPGEVAWQAVRIARRVAPRLSLGVEILDRCITDNASPRLFTEATLVDPPQVAASFEALASKPITKLLMIGDPGELGGVQMMLLDQLKGQVSFAFSHQTLLQVVSAHADKGAGLATVARYYHVPRQRVMAIGDAPNDLPMLQWAGLSVAMGNAWDDVRRAAHFVVSGNDQDGVAEAVARYVLMH
jgi:Cof subfamily protein (haloacid dehalogenase superfamily)